MASNVLGTISHNSKKPSGLSITRNGNKFICEWKIPSEKYGDGQQFQATDVSSTSISKTATKKTVEIDLSSLYPSSSTKLVEFWFKVRGNTDQNKNDMKTWSNWSLKTFVMYAPRTPSLTAELTGTNKCKFTWSVADTGNDTHYPFKRVLMQTKLIKDCTWKPEEDDWSFATEYTSNDASNFREITEDNATLATGNYTRIVRIKAQGCAGDSDWAYASHVYGSANQASQSAGSVKDTASGYDVTVRWDTAYDRSTPIDESIVEWVIATPASDMSCPSGQSWNAGATVQDTKGKEAAHVTVDATLELDKCLYTRVNTKHDSNITYGAAVLQKIGRLSPPTGLTVENVDMSSQTAKITATNQSAVPGTILEIIYRKNGSETIVGTIDGSPNYKTVKCPAWTNTDKVSFGVKAVLPKSISSKTTDGVSIYTIKPYMDSETVWQVGTVATAPTGLALDKVDDDVRAIWSNNWSDANIIELSWSDNRNAWESTDAPKTFEINNPFATTWRISGLEAGKIWYVKVRSIHDSGEGKTYSPYSDIREINLSSPPGPPTLAVSKGIISLGESFTASWEYESTDGTPQAEARIYRYSSGTYTLIGRASTQEHIDLPGWKSAGTYWICVEVISGSGQSSGKSTLVSITVAPAVTCSMTNSLENKQITDDDGTTRTVKALTAMPLTVTVTGAGTGGTTSVVIERAEAYHVDKPDESELTGFYKETIFDRSMPGAGQMTIRLGDLLGSLDDGAKYVLRAIVTDNIGQTAKTEQVFYVHWTHQALIPSGSVIIDEEKLAAIVKPIAPTGTIQTDRCDIYRLSADKPVLVYKGALFGSRYVDPYPAIGKDGGYRFVFITENGDYNTSENVLAMYDAKNEHLELNSTIIDFDGGRIALRYDLDLSSSWEKEFTEKKFLGGSVRGYWQEGVSRKNDISAAVVPADEEDAIAVMRKLSEYTGKCHVRTPEGSSFPADIQVRESWESGTSGKVAKFSLTITRVEEEMDGMTYEEWIGGSA